MAYNYHFGKIISKTIFSTTFPFIGIYKIFDMVTKTVNEPNDAFV